MQLLCLSNGHGEDLIGARILACLRGARVEQLVALPLVGTGQAYQRQGFPLWGPTLVMPSGGFINQDGRQFLADLRQGLLGLTWQQWQRVRLWSRAGGRVLAVGDILPLLFAWGSGGAYAFVGTAKSEYYRTAAATTAPAVELGLDWSGDGYFPWEYWLMRHQRCQAVFPRDALTAKSLLRQNIPAHDLGNPMMDGLAADLPPNWLQGHPLTVLLLPGSRAPEAYRNWLLLLQAIPGLLATLPVAKQPLLFLAAIDPGLELGVFRQSLPEMGWQPAATPATLAGLLDFRGAIGYGLENSHLLLTQTGFGLCLHLADLAIAMAGTASEQFAGLGKPIVTFPGGGPQFTRQFAERQTRLLGISLTLVDRPEQVGKAVLQLLNNPELLARIRENGHQRLGPAGAAERIAAQLLTLWSD